jgi:hypothetical protein
MAWSRGTQIFQKSGSHLQIVGAVRVTRNKLHTEDSQLWSDMSVSLLLDVFSIQFMCTEARCSVWGKNCNNDADNVTRHRRKCRQDEQEPAVCVTHSFCLVKLVKMALIRREIYYSVYDS